MKIKNDLRQPLQASYSDLKALLSKGFAPDFQSLDKILIENNHCPGCRRKYVYQGISNATEYRAFGVCEPCKFARQFWLEAAIFNTVKKKFCAA